MECLKTLALTKLLYQNIELCFHFENVKFDIEFSENAIPDGFVRLNGPRLKYKYKIIVSLTILHETSLQRLYIPNNFSATYKYNISPCRHTK